MGYNPEKHNRRSALLKGYDYSSPGLYFVTICTHNRVCLFGEISGGKMTLNEWGRVARDQWQNTESIRDTPLLRNNTPTQNNKSNHQSEFRSPSKTLGAIVRGYKSAVTTQINKKQNTPGQKVWQRNYYDSIIRDKQSLERIQYYIINNPVQWEEDQNNPKNF